QSGFEVAMSTYGGTITGGISLVGTPQNPATVTASGYITNTTTLHSGDAVYGNTATAWNITNLGIIKATGTYSSGLDLRAGGSITNASGALIAGVYNGIAIRGNTGTVTNSGTIKGTGAFGYGVYLKAGGTVTNNS